jgi:putative transcription antitermination factor YqgF
MKKSSTLSFPFEGVIRGVLLRERLAGIVAGYPVQLDGVEGNQADKTILFLAQLRELGDVKLDMVLFSERFSTTSARQDGRQRKAMSKANEKKWIDNSAACFILQSYLDAADFYREHDLLDKE